MTAIKNNFENIISISNLKKSFGDKTVLDGVSLDIKQGESSVILGGSGSGKTVFLRCLLGLEKPTSGSVKILGKEVKKLNEKQYFDIIKNFGMVFQKAALFDSMTIWQNVAFYMLNNTSMKESDAKKLAIEKLELVGLESRVADLKPAELSGGMQKRAAFARAICNSPKIIFYDEPTTGLDPLSTDTISNLINTLKQELGVSSITITHDIRSAFDIADNISVLKNGKFVVQGEPNLILDSKDPYVEAFLGPFKAKR